MWGRRRQPAKVRTREMTVGRMLVVVETHLRDISLELPAQLHQVLVGMFALLLSASQLRRYRVELPLQNTQKTAKQ